MIISRQKYVCKNFISIIFHILILIGVNINPRIANASSTFNDSFFKIVHRPKYSIVNDRRDENSPIHTQALFEKGTKLSDDQFHNQHILTVVITGNDHTIEVNPFYEKANKQRIEYYQALMYLENDIGQHLSQTQRWQQAVIHINNSRSNKAQLLLAQMYLDRQVDQKLTTNQNSDMACEILQNLNTDDAKYEMSVLYQSHKIARNLTNQQRYLLAEQLLKGINTPDAKYSLGTLHANLLIEDGLTDAEHYQIARQCFEQSELPEAKLNLAILYAKDLIGLELSPQERYTLAQQICEHLLSTNVDCFAYLLLGIMYENSQLGGKLENTDCHEKAAEYYKLSNTRSAKFALAMLLKKKLIKRFDCDDDLLKYVATLLDESDIPKANNVLAQMYRDDQAGGDMNLYDRLNITSTLLHKSKTGSALFNLGYMCLNSQLELDLSVKDTLRKAKYFFSQALSEGVDEAKTCIKLINKHINLLKPVVNPPITANESISSLLRQVFKNEPFVKRPSKKGGKSISNSNLRVNSSHQYRDDSSVQHTKVLSEVNQLLQEHMLATIAKLAEQDEQITIDDLLSSEFNN